LQQAETRAQSGVADAKGQDDVGWISFLAHIIREG